MSLDQGKDKDIICDAKSIFSSNIILWVGGDKDR